MKILLAAMLVLGCGAACADQLDVLAYQRELGLWEADLKAFHERVAYISFGYGCKIITHPAQVTMLLQPLYDRFNQKAASMNLHGYDYRRFNPEYKNAGRIGFQRSQVLGQCDYWTANKEKAVSLRADANSLMNYMGPPEAHPQMPYLFK